MLTPMKVLLLLFLAAILWYGFRFFRWQSRIRKEIHRHMEEARREAARGGPPPPAEPEGEVDDLAACPVCGTYGVPGQMKNCQRPGCPYPG